MLAADAELMEHLAPGLLGIAWVGDERERAALRDRPAKEAARGRGGEQRGDACRAGRLAGDRHLLRVAPEGRDVVAHPRERRDLIADPEVARDPRLAAQGAAEIDEAQAAEP